ncbi:MAG: DEAD/DEAH box helicase family protein [Rubrobacteraceae bacterium]
MKPDERAFEDHITRSLLENSGYREIKAGNASGDFDPDLGLDTTELFAFIQETQPEAWELLVKRRGDAARAREGFLDRLTDQLDTRGTLDVLRHGVEDYGVKISLVFFKPAHTLTHKLQTRYDANRLTVTRQLPYERESNKTLDLGLFVNGIPVATAELKNLLTGQGVEEAKKQYREDRDPKNTTLRRAVVHFAVDPEEVAMTTRLEDASTRFLPFNKGSGAGVLGGKGNPPNPADPHGHRTTYLWEQVWAKDAWMDLLGRFIHAEKPEEDGFARSSVRTRKPGRVIFPRYHQWDAVLKMTDHARENGPGETYLVQHSAGSGKSNTIAWLAHRLSNLHDEQNNKVFDKVVVITDRLVLDRQLQETIYQFEHQRGVVERITESSSQLAEALTGETARIIITTLQKFPFVLDKIEDLPARSYAILVDEAHSSQTGETAKDVKRALGKGRADGSGTDEPQETDAQEPEDPAQEALLEEVAARGEQENLSFFAFTATPKGRTLEMFGTLEPASGHNVPFHLYSMRQSIEEGFSLDVLANYMTYDTFWKIEKTIEDDPEYDPTRAGAAIARFVGLHPHNLSQKAQVIVEHFRKHVAHKIGGRAKAMVVTSSRLHAVRMTRHLREYANEHGYDALGILVAFSDTVTDEGVPYTEAAMNAFPESQTPTEFEKDHWRFLVVAEKYQTGFDQPLLYAMYVDKILTGLAAVQTLSRLNRPAEGKDGTFVLDFRNEAEAIQKEFEPYYGRTVTQPTDPNLLYDARAALDPYGVIRSEEVEQATALLVAGGGKGHGRLHAALAPAVDRFYALTEEDQEAFRDDLGRFVRYYSFLSQVISFGAVAMERDYRYARALSSLIRHERGASLDLGTEVELTHLQLEPAFEGSLSLTSEEGEVSAISDGHGPQSEKPEASPLSRIVDNLNERYGLNLTEADKLHFDGIAQDLVESDTVQRQAGANSLENFATQFPDHFTRAVAERLAGAEDLTIELLDNEELAEDVRRVYLPLVYSRAKVARQEHCPIGELLGPPPKEGAHLEYKSTFRTRAKDGPNGEPAGEVFKPLETATLKTIAGFLNSREGGTLLIGVADDGSVFGLESDYASLRKEGKDDRDLFGLHLNQTILNSVGPAAAANVTHEILHVGSPGDDLCRVHVRPSGFPVEAKVTEVDKQGQYQKVVFYGRFGGATRAISDESELERYKQQIWGF